MASRAVAKIKVHHKGGAKNSRYIGSLRDEVSREPDREVNEPSFAGPERDDLQPEMDGDDDRIWGWNVPCFVADDGYGIWETEEGRATLESHSLTLSAHHLGLGPPPPLAEKLSGEEKRENLVAHFSALAELEERKRQGLSHIRIILTVGLEVTDQELRKLTLDFLRKNFLLCQAFAAIHRDTKHAHVHLYIHARQLNERKLDLKQEYFHLDESWMKICAEGLKAPEIYDIHIKLKGETDGWKDRCQQASAEGKALPPKPDRWADHHDTLLIYRPFDDRWCGRLQAQTRVAEMKVVWLEATRAKAEEVSAARTTAEALREKLDSASERRSNSKRESKRLLPAEIITVREARELKGYERDLRDVEKNKDAKLRETVVSQQTLTQAVLDFEEPVVAREIQTGFDFGPSPMGKESGDDSRARSLTVSESTKGEHETGELLKSPISVAMTSSDQAARMLGLELMAEARLAYIEVHLGSEQSRQVKTKLKAELLASQSEHANASQAAEACRATLRAQNLGEPTYQLRSDERDYLTFVSRHVPELLCERIAREVDRAEIIPNRVKIVESQAEHSVRREEDERTRKASVEPQPTAVMKQPPTITREHTESKVFVREDNVPGRIISSTTPVGTAERNIPQTLPDVEVEQLFVNLELARARTLFLLSEEHNFAAIPQWWISPLSGLSLAGVERQVDERLKQKKDVNDLRAHQKQLQSEIAEERQKLPLKKTEAEHEMRTLETRLRTEVSARQAIGMPVPAARYTEEQVRELMSHAEISRDTQLLERIYKIERVQAIDDARSADNPEIIRRLEEKYAGLQLQTEIDLYRDEKSLEWERKHPLEILLPARNREGRDIAVSLAQYEPQKGLRGALGKLIEKQEHREMRERLEVAKGSYLQHREREVEAQTGYHENLRSLANDCYELSKGYGYPVPAAPALSAKQIAEIRAYAVVQPEGVAKPWLKRCAEAQSLQDGWNAKPFRTRESSGDTTPSPEALERKEKIQRELEESRRTRERMRPAPARIAIPREPPKPVAHERSDLDKTSRSGRGGRG